MQLRRVQPVRERVHAGRDAVRAIERLMHHVSRFRGQVCAQSAHQLEINGQQRQLLADEGVIEQLEARGLRVYGPGEPER